MPFELEGVGRTYHESGALALRPTKPTEGLAVLMEQG